MNTTLFYGLTVILVVLIIASLTIVVLARRYPQRDWIELRQRITSWWWIVAVFALAITTPKVISLSIFALISFLALREYLSLIPQRDSDSRMLWWAYIIIPIQYLWIGIEWYGLFVTFIPIYVFLFIPMRMVMIGNNQDFLRSVAVLYWGIITTVFAISHVAYLMVLPDSNPNMGALLVIFLVALTECNDIAQYLWGKSLGKTKVIAKVSPNKTLEGLVGGVATTVFLAWILGGILTPMSAWQSIFAGLLIGCSGFIGDVVMSAVKRDIGVKDSGKLLPGHGGILDRLDSLIYTAPLFFHYLHYLYY